MRPVYSTALANYQRLRVSGESNSIRQFYKMSFVSIVSTGARFQLDSAVRCIFARPAGRVPLGTPRKGVCPESGNRICNQSAGSCSENMSNRGGRHSNRLVRGGLYIGNRGVESVATLLSGVSARLGGALCTASHSRVRPRLTRLQYRPGGGRR